jgi:iron complex outermembrane receptor protein
MSKHRKPPLAVARAAAILALGIVLAPATTLHAQTQPMPVEAPSSSASQAPAFDIPAQDLSKALAEFARQSGLELLYTPEIVEGLTASAVKGQHTREAAMTLLLQGTDLDFIVAPSGGMVIGDRAMLEAHRTRMRGNGGASVASPDGSVSLAEAVPGAPALTGESIISTVETARRGGIEEIIVTGQKKEERLQDVPIAISAFSAEQLDAQKIEGGFDLLKAVPNVTFSKSNYSSYNFSIRGVGTKAVSATADPGVAISFNNVPLIRNRLFEQEYFDVERVEVLRGPQGTLYGRNATGGVVNMITNKPDFQEFEGMLKAEAGNYDARRMTGMINVPIIDDVLALRIAGATTQRDGYGINLTTGKPSDDRDLWSSRITLGFRPNDRVRANFIWEHFNEDDSRLRTGKQLCHRDEGPEILEGVDGPLDQYARGRINQGCKIGSLYDDNAFGKPNGWSLPFTYFMANALFYIGYDKPAGQPNRTVVPLVRRDQDPYGYDMQSRDLRAIESIIEPKYRAEADIFAFNLDVDLTDTLLFSSQTAYNEDYVWSLQDYMRFSTPPAFNDSNLVYGQNSPIPGQGLNGISLPGGVFTDPQIGPSNTLKGFEVSSSASTQFSQEFRLQSDFDAPLNFSLGINYLSFKGNNDYYLFFNIATMIAEQYYNRGTYIPNEVGFVYVDRSPFESIAGDGHNYFRNQNPYELESRSAFGELYWQVADSVKLTAGLRYTDDKKK